MNNKTKAQLLSLISALTILTGCGNKKDNEVVEEKPVNEIHVVQPIHIESDCYDVEAEVESLNIVEYDNVLSNVFKVLRFIDKDHYERIAIVKTYVNFYLDDNNNIIGNYYSMYDAFSGEHLFTTAVSKNQTINTSYMTNPDIISIISYDKLSSLKTIAISKGMDETYVNSVMPDIDDKQTISTYQVACYYVQLVNSNNRLNNEYKLG